MSITISEIIDTSTHLSGNPVKVKATTSGIPAGATEYKILLKLVSADDVLYGSPFIDAIAPDSNGVAEFDVSGIVDQAIEKDFRWPIPGLYDGKWHGYPYQVYDVPVIPGERYIDSNGVLQESFAATWGTLFIVKGKLPNHKLAELNTVGSTWFDWFCTGGRWLTFMPVTQVVSPYQPVKLWWKPPTTSLTLNYTVKGYYSDGSTRSYVSDVTMWYDVMFEFDLHPAGLDIPPMIGEARLLYYEAWMTGVPNVEKRTFIIDWNYHEENWYLFVDNRIGGVDCIWLSGAAQYNPSGHRDMVTKAFEPGSGIKKRTKYTSGETRIRKWNINTGFKTREEIETLDFLLDSPFAWLAIPPVGGSSDISQYKLAPVNVTSSELPIPDNSNDLFSLDLEITEAY